MHCLRRLFMDKIEIGVYYYTDESGNKVYDVQEMFEELDRKIYDLQQKETDNGLDR